MDQQPDKPRSNEAGRIAFGVFHFLLGVGLLGPLGVWGVFRLVAGTTIEAINFWTVMILFLLGTMFFFSGLGLVWRRPWGRIITLVLGYFALITFLYLVAKSFLDPDLGLLLCTVFPFLYAAITLPVFHAQDVADQFR